jgi:hypothetical protein
MLTKAQEVALAQAMQTGRSARDRLGDPRAGRQRRSIRAGRA